MEITTMRPIWRLRLAVEGKKLMDGRAIKTRAAHGKEGQLVATADVAMSCRLGGGVAIATPNAPTSLGGAFGVHFALEWSANLKSAPRRKRCRATAGEEADHLS
ncbi:hypothetical protein [Cupriavidus necator]